MKLVTFVNTDKEQRLGLYIQDKVIDLQKCGEKLSISMPSNMLCFLQAGEELMDKAREIETAVNDGKLGEPFESGDPVLIAPIPNPPSCRDAYAFRQHVATARRNRGVEMIPEFDQYPIFYFTNHNAIYGGGDITVETDHLQKLDFELEAAVVIGRKGKNIDSSHADKYIAGYTIMNDLSARVLQMEEMKLNLGPAKGKDFATTIGPWLVTPDELNEARVETEFGDKYNLRMTASHNGKLVSDGNLSDINWSFAEIIERCSYGTEIYPGDVIGSGTVGTGCFLELNGTGILEAKKNGDEFTPVWLANGDTITLEIEKLGKLSNRVVKSDQDHSILAKKKNI